jgi:hypothetical protein
MRTSSNRRKTKRILFITGLALAGAALITLVCGFVFLDRHAWITSRKLSTALKGARSVIFVEHTADIEIARKTATPADIMRLRDAINLWPRPFVPKTYLCWVPHHSIEIVRSNGSPVNVDICFVCGKFAIEDAFVAPLPPYLTRSLAAFFASVGMAPKDDEEYIRIEMAEHRRQGKE